MTVPVLLLNSTVECLVFVSSSHLS